MNHTTLTKFIAASLAITMMCPLMTSCGKSESASASTTLTYELPANCSLSEDEMVTAINEYTKYVSSALGGDGYNIEFKVKNDGTCMFAGQYVSQAPASSATTNRTSTSSSSSSSTLEDETIPDLITFQSVEECFAYLYQSGQIDKDGNIIAGLASADNETEPKNDSSSITLEAPVDASSIIADESQSTSSASQAESMPDSTAK